jgi:leucyl aminopeptidase (aminopeptidase T)
VKKATKAAILAFMENKVQTSDAKTMTALPPVAKSIFVHCKKCEADRYHIVLAHKTASSASVQCEICKAKSTFKLPKAGADGAPRKLTGAAAKKKAESASRAKNAHSNEYNTLMASVQADSVRYNMKTKFTMNAKLEHPKFGTGFVKASMIDKIEVVFEDEVRMLVHNRQ